jgi:hypothetical protein
VRASLAAWTGVAGDAAAARDLLAGLLPVRARVSGPEHPDTLAVRASLAAWTGVAGDAAAARDQFAALLPVRARVSGPEHPGTLAVRASLAAWTGVAGDAAAARDQLAALPVTGQGLSGEPADPTAMRVRWLQHVIWYQQPVQRAVAAAFLIASTGAVAADGAWELATELDGLPLALEQAVAYMQATGRTIAEYLALFRERRLSMPPRAEPAGYDQRAASTCALALEQLQKAGPAAIGLLRLLDCFCPAAETIPLELVLRPSPELEEVFGPEVAPLLMPLLERPVVVGDAIAALRRYSLIGSPPDGAVSVPRLVQTVTLAQLPADLASAWRQAARSLIEKALTGDPRQPATWPAYAALLPHVRSALAPYGDAVAKAADYLGYSGRYSAARTLHRQILEARERELGPEHPDTLSARGKLADGTGAAGDAAAARDQLAALLPVCERVLGPEHFETLKTRASLAAWTGDAGNAAAARDQLAALLPVCERVLGAEHPATLDVRG